MVENNSALRILVATGGSSHSDDAVYSGVKLARNICCSMTILTVIKDREKWAEGQSIIERAVSLISGAKESPTPEINNFNINSKIRIGHPAEEIVHEAKEGNYKLIVVGTWPRHNLVSRLLAPTTERVIMQAPCPVMVAKGKLSSLNNVLLCISGANTPSKAAQFWGYMANHIPGDMNITILHVMSQLSASQHINTGWQLQATAEQLIEEDTPEGQWIKREIGLLKKTRAHIQPKVRHGFVVDEVLIEARNGKYDLLVVGAHRHEGWQRFLLDDLSHQIIIQADRPVLVV